MLAIIEETADRIHDKQQLLLAAQLLQTRKKRHLPRTAKALDRQGSTLTATPFRPLAPVHLKTVGPEHALNRLHRININASRLLLDQRLLPLPLQLRLTPRPTRHVFPLPDLHQPQHRLVLLPIGAPLHAVYAQTQPLQKPEVFYASLPHPSCTVVVGVVHAPHVLQTRLLLLHLHLLHHRRWRV